MAVTTLEEICIGCGACVDECPQEALALIDDDHVEVDEDVCIDCGICVDACPMEALEL